MKHKLMQAMKERDDTRALGGLVQLDDAYWGGERHGKRGRGAGAKTPFVAAVETNAEGQPLAMRLSCVRGFRNDEIGAWACKHLCPGSVVVTDGLACFGAVRQAGCIHEPVVTGGGPASAQRPQFPLGQHPAWKRQARDQRNLPFGQCQTSAAIPRRVSRTASTGATASRRWCHDWPTSHCGPRRCPTGLLTLAEPQW